MQKMSSLPLYSELGTRYQQAYSGPYDDMTVVIDDSRLIIACKDGKLSGFGRPAICVGDANKVLPAFKNLYEAFPNIWYMDYLRDNKLDAISAFLLKNGLAAQFYYTQIIDLTATKEQLHAQLRKSYKNLVNKYQTYIASNGWTDPEILESGDNSGDNDINYIIENFRILHWKMYGRFTRNEETWRLQASMIRQNQAFVYTNYDKSAMGLFIHDKNTCYYGVNSSCGDEISHPLVWSAILHAKTLGCREFELGEQKFKGDEKLMDISYFKRGFGGSTKLRLEFGKEKE